MKDRAEQLIHLKLIAVAIMWGGTFIATKMASAVFGTFTGAALRYVFALVLMIPMLYLQNRQAFRINRKQFVQLLILGFSGIFAYSFFFFTGLKHVKASHGALIVALNPVMVMVLSAAINKERIRPMRLVGILLSLSGTALVISRGNPADLFTMFGWGDALMLGCPVSWAVYTYFAKDALKLSTPLQASTWAIILGLALISFFIPSETYPSQVSLDIWMALAYLGVCGSFLGFVWYYQGISKIGPVKTAAYNNLIPVFAMLLSVIILGESIELHTIYGSLLVIGGVYLVNRY